MRKSKFIIFTIFLASCAGTPVEVGPPAPPTFKQPVEEVVVEPTLETNQQSIETLKISRRKKRFTRKVPFEVGEKVVLDVKFLGVQAGEISIQTPKMVKLDGKLAYYFQGNAKTSPLFSLFYTVDDSVGAYVSVRDFLPLKHEMHVYETKRTQYRVVIFDQKKKIINQYDRLIKPKKPPQITEFEMKLENNALDTFGVLYWMRAQPLSVGKTYHHYVYDNGKYWLLETVVLRKEKVRTPFGKIDALVLEPRTYFQGVLKRKAKALIWVSDDERKIPLKMSISVKFGSIIASVKEVYPPIIQ